MNPNTGYGSYSKSPMPGVLTSATGPYYHAPFMEAGAVSLFFSRYLYYPVVLILLFNLLQRRYKEKGLLKRFATLYLGIIVISLWAFSFLFLRFGIPDILLLSTPVVYAVLIIAFRDRMLPFRFRCTVCGRRLPSKTVIFVDSNRCPACEEAV